jgi:hypothetical protein
MKESLYHPHFLDLDLKMKAFDGNVNKSFISKPPFYMTEEIMGFKLIGPASFKDQIYYRCEFHQHFTCAFFVRKFCAKLFLYLHFRFEIFLVLKYWRKCTHKMLVKLITGNIFSLLNHSYLSAR